MARNYYVTYSSRVFSPDAGSTPEDADATRYHVFNADERLRRRFRRDVDDRTAERPDEGASSFFETLWRSWNGTSTAAGGKEEEEEEEGKRRRKVEAERRRRGRANSPPGEGGGRRRGFRCECNPGWYGDECEKCKLSGIRALYCVLYS